MSVAVSTENEVHKKGAAVKMVHDRKKWKY